MTQHNDATAANIVSSRRIIDADNEQRYPLIQMRAIENPSLAKVMCLPTGKVAFKAADARRMALTNTNLAEMLRVMHRGVMRLVASDVPLSRMEFVINLGQPVSDTGEQRAVFKVSYPGVSGPIELFYAIDPETLATRWSMRHGGARWSHEDLNGQLIVPQSPGEVSPPREVDGRNTRGVMLG